MHAAADRDRRARERSQGPGGRRAGESGRCRAVEPGRCRAVEPGRCRAVEPGRCRAVEPGRCAATLANWPRCWPIGQGGEDPAGLVAEPGGKRRRRSLARRRAVRQPTAQERPALAPVHAPRRRHLLPRLRRRPARLRPRYRHLRALGPRSGVRPATRDRRGQGGGAPRRGHARHPRGPGRGAGRRVPQGARPAARRDAVRAPRRHRRRARGPRARAVVPGQLQRLPRHRAVPARTRSPPPARRSGDRAAVPQPLRLHRHGQRGGRQGRRHEHHHRRPERPLPRVGAAQLRRQQAEGCMQCGGRGRRPAVGGADRPAVRPHLPRSADLLELQEDGAGDLRGAPRPRRPDPPGRAPAARARRSPRLCLQRAQVRVRRRGAGPRPRPRGSLEGDVLLSPRSGSSTSSATPARPAWRPARAAPRAPRPST